MPRGLARVMNHTAVPVRILDSGIYIEGEKDETVEEGPAFRCAFFPPGTREAGNRGRRIEQPQMLFMDPDPDGVAVGLTAEDKIDLQPSPDLSPEYTGVYAFDGPPQALGKPGKVPVGYLALLKRVVD